MFGIEFNMVYWLVNYPFFLELAQTLPTPLNLKRRVVYIYIYIYKLTQNATSVVPVLLLFSIY